MLTEDINIHFYEEGEPAYYDGSSSLIKVIFSRTSEEFTNGQTTIRTHEVTALCKSADIPNLAANKTLSLKSTNYYIIDWNVLENADLTLCYLSAKQA